MTDFTVHTPDTAPDDSKPLLSEARGVFGFVPNLMGELAESPAALGAYLSLNELFGDKSSLSAQEQQVVLLAVSFYNECSYCMAAHTGGARQSGLSAEAVAALRRGDAPDDPKLGALHRFTTAVVAERGWVDDAEVGAFLDAGYDRRQLLEVLVGVAMKTLSNYTNHIAGTPLDEALQPLAWEKETATATA
jgi:uncharacterized peroxidase-related enzyme